MSDDRDEGEVIQFDTGTASDSASTFRPAFRQPFPQAKPAASNLSDFTGLREDVRDESSDALSQILIETLMLRALYESAAWQIRGPVSPSLRPMLLAHRNDQTALADALADRVRMLGGTPLALPSHISDMSHVDDPSDDDNSDGWTERLLSAHRLGLGFARDAAVSAREAEDAGTQSFISTRVIALNEAQAGALADTIAG